MADNAQATASAALASCPHPPAVAAARLASRDPGIARRRRPRRARRGADAAAAAGRRRRRRRRAARNSRASGHAIGLSGREAGLIVVGRRAAVQLRLLVAELAALGEKVRLDARLPEAVIAEMIFDRIALRLRDRGISAVAKRDHRGRGVPPRARARNPSQRLGDSMSVRFVRLSRAGREAGGMLGDAATVLRGEAGGAGSWREGRRGIRPQGPRPRTGAARERRRCFVWRGRGCQPRTRLPRFGGLKREQLLVGRVADRWET